MKFTMPETIEELKQALKEADGSWLCAGGTDLTIQLREKKQFHYSLIDLTHIPELSQIKEEGELLRIGAAATMDDLENHPLIARWVPALSKAASLVGSTQIRNRATVGGNVANASQSSDLTPVLIAYGASAAVCDEAGQIDLRSVDAIVEGLGKTKLKGTEAILWFLVRKSDALSGFSKIGSRKSVAISKVNACIKAEVDEGRMDRVIVTLGAVGPKARRAPLIEKALQGMSLDYENVDSEEKARLKEAVYAQIEENIPDRSSKHYKKPVSYGIICDILEELWRQKKRRMQPDALSLTGADAFQAAFQDEIKGGEGVE